MVRRLLLTILCTAAAGALVAATASAETIKYRFGPIDVKPGQNTIDFKPNGLKPDVPGYITAFRPNLTYLNGKVPGVDVVHLHHGVWLVDLYPTYAAGEEKTNVELPKGYGYDYEPRQKWVMNYMVHNLTPTPTKVYLTYELDFIPKSDPAARGMKTVRTQWMDVEAGKVYPVFDALRSGGGKDGEYTYPTEASNPYQGRGQPNSWTVEQDGTLVQTAGHLHPGGLHTDLYLTRDGRTTRLFRSDAKYFEPAGAVSWDVAMMNTADDWRPAVKRGDVITVTGTYDTSKASWYESMAIMPVAYSPGDTTGVDPFSGELNTKGELNHGHLAENDNHGGGRSGLPDARRLKNGRSGLTAASGTIDIEGFLYENGDLSNPMAAGRPPTVAQGGSLTFKNLDDDQTIWHTVTACKAPCNKRTGIAYPLANGAVDFDSGELGTGPPGHAAANRLTWQTPKDLSAGTYTYFCRVHPFMRGAFRVVPR